MDTRAGQGWQGRGQQRDGSLYCPKTQDSLNAQRVQFPYWSGDLELHHPSAKTDPGPRHLPRVSGGVFTTCSVLHGYTGHRDLTTLPLLLLLVSV